MGMENKTRSRSLMSSLHVRQIGSGPKTSVHSESLKMKILERLNQA